MAAIPDSTKTSIRLRLRQHARDHWPQITDLDVTYHGAFIYVSAAIDDSDEPIPLFRLRYGGSAHSFGFAIYSPARDRYERSLLLTGLPAGTPQEALDTTAIAHALTRT
ncbi:MAG TPA: hypothetical protein VGA04_26080 [Streptosporangiaceae bacterium]|nr:hypothetical protein [Candidatus Limnocylindria bacterium]